MQTYSGIHFYPLDPRPEDIDILDIAHSLSMQCRYSGHTTVHYSVAEHCVRTARIVSLADALWALLHDAAEAYLMDLPRPIKNMPDFTAYKIAERLVMEAVKTRFHLEGEEPESVRWADRVLLATEARDLMGDPKDWAPMPEPLRERIVPWNYPIAEHQFMSVFGILSAGALI